MKPVIALIGRPNVGKSTLFNCLTRTRNALVADQPGLTRDRNYGEGRVGDKAYLVVDTGGLIDSAAEGIEVLMADQVWMAVEEADHVFFLVDGRAGLQADDREIAARLRRTAKPIHIVVNKTEGLDETDAVLDFHALGFGAPVAIAASHGQGIESLMTAVCAELPDEPGADATERGIGVAVIGRPNVGKSTLVNRILGEQRVLAFDEPGTTRDSIFIPFNRDGVQYTLIDTAGVRRRGRVEDKLEKFSVIKTLQAIEQCDVAVLLLDAHLEVSDQDAHLLGFILDAGRALIIAVNKWDGLDDAERRLIRAQLERKLSFVDFARIHFISALHGSGVGELFTSIKRAYDCANLKLNTQQLTRILEDAVAAHQPPLVRGRRIKLRYAHQGGRRPPVVIIHGNQTADVPVSYQRYLMKAFRTALQLEGTPIRVEFKSGVNPYAHKRNVLTERQISQRKRLMRHVKGRGR